MNLNELKKKLQPKLVEHDIDGMKIYIHRPKASDFAKCTDYENILMLCVKDENGDPIFSNEDIDNRINVHSIDSIIAGNIVNAINKLTIDTDAIDEVEKK